MHWLDNVGRSTVTGAEAVRIRYLIRRDMPSVMEINDELGIATSETEYKEFLRKRDCIGMVAEIDDVVVGYVMYRFSKQNTEIVHFGVNPHASGKGVGRAMVEKLKAKDRIIKTRRKIIACVDEYNVAFQVFLRACGFRCVKAERGFFEHGDMFLFELELERVVGGVD